MTSLIEARGDYLRDPDEIYRRSFATIRAEADLARFTPDEADVAARIIHACGMVDLAGDIAFTEDAVASGIRSLSSGHPIFCDVQMVVRGITRRLLPETTEVLCTLDHEGMADRAKALRTTRSAAAVDLWADRLDEAVLVFGNAPTALFHLLDLVTRLGARPALVVGMPVGFVGAVESKEALAAQPGLPSIIVRGRRGGSAMAAAAVNALAILSKPAR